jgi:site-specific DNA-cytosine methylase
VSCTLKGEGGGLGAKTGLYTVYGNPSGTRTLHPNVPEVGEAERVYDPSGVSPPVKESGVNVLPPASNAVDCGGHPGVGVAPKGTRALPEALQPFREVASLREGQIRIRRLTPRETERLQGFPPDFTKWGADEGGRVVEVSDSQRYRMMGNAVTVPVAEALGRAINAYMRTLGWA